METLYGRSPRHVIVRELEARDGTPARCFYCDELLSPYRTHIDHVIPAIRNGPNTLDNLVLACQGCNIRKKQRPGWGFVVLEELARWERGRWIEHCLNRPLEPYVVYG